MRGARLFDDERIIEADSVVVEDGLIKQVGTGLSSPASGVWVDAHGGTLLPGLIDAHTHVDYSGESDAVRFGVTTMLDMFNDPSRLSGWRSLRTSMGDVKWADVWSAGVLVTVPGGHGTQYGIPIATLKPGDDADAFVAARLAEGSDYIKVVIEDGSAFGRHLQTLTAAQVAAVVSAARARGAFTVVHVSTVAGAAEAIAAGADGLAHVPCDRLMGNDLVQRIKSQGKLVISTLAVHASSACTSDGRQLAQDPRVAPFLTAHQTDSLSARFSGDCFPAQAGASQDNLAALHRAGVAVLAGTDAGNPGTTFGASLHEELELLIRAGLTPAQALTAATSAPAMAFRIGDRGRIAPGLRADLLLVRGDPTSDITATRDIVTVWKNGYVIDRTP